MKAISLNDVAASIVVFLVAIPLCLGIAIASGVPVAMGLVSGIIGGIVVGALAGSPLQVSGPAAGLAVIVFGFVEEYGVAALGPVLVAAGALQILAGFLKIGSWFRAISPAVVHGMLAGIGILIILGQTHVLMDARPAAGAVENVTAISSSIGNLWSNGITNEALALMVGLASLAAMVSWEKFRPASLRLLPPALIGVSFGTTVTVALNLPIARVTLPASLGEGISVPAVDDFIRLTEPGILGTVLVIAIIASAETLLSAAAVDRMHDGPRTRFNKELFAQGVGNGICGMLGALPITGVIVRSSANIQAGAKTRASAIMHGVWVLALVALLPQLLGLVPLSALAAVLLVTGWRLVSLHHVRHLHEHHGWLPVAIWLVTVTMVVTQDLLIGVALGFILSLMEVLPYLRNRLRIDSAEEGETISVRLSGSATCKDVPALLTALESLPANRNVQLAGQDLGYLDHTCAETISEWLKRESRTGRLIKIVGGMRDGTHPRIVSMFRRYQSEARNAA
ncbi:MFS superfamily sulfate permease-like transporter [Agrobacterium tumefaciens]|uniref:MFS superfamily sulfate permease-like transporter n=1 Tax=Agrobacterium radiobacter TaxID=362 RepID=A0ABR6JEA5_AGRRD|nr:SulP family inorganic anion transporter [Agrobacterium radiobacter]MBB4321272.1 MFS superfamily sulfate permease-like transporter [Agrobacterium radiobacter]MBB4338312.1 MFS superfamily sulfate permease-like transporter [Agrobacterium radiobacter]MBB4493200.1 MFS superfamily sulfate permease-like transporter [Agrobacterium radiobacter]MBB4498473.1 MFS superfamily sulfate permease-like transporter [Agrobacterium radiobacter]MBB4503828.1 MFS superfamily sulfate permease-like transporter [Agro